ncbi:tetratricopeptide repeat protein [Flavobacterium orientale]|uniref:BatC protein n=1 Tax=Flavobacterium orientale TaxID=1756020 RepID=A0A916XW69_9FLAO|nr:tetratricopeptide repeat protein [Flavobacterium orientale]GGD17252.1 BatC protein [Flavobacterium orientale]
MKKQLILLFFFAASILSAQEEKKEKDKVLPKANKEFQNQKFKEAEAKYRISNSKDLSGSKAAYNLGNAIYRQDQSSEAKFAYSQALEKATTKQEKHKAFHNIGNVFMKEKQYGKAVEAYKNALRNNPSDEQTRYNYALAKEYLKNNPEDPDDKGENDKEKSDDKKDENKEKQDQDNKDQDKKDQNEQGDNKKDNQDKEQKGQPKPQPSGITKERLENLLEAVNKEEKKVQDKVNKEKIKASPVQTEKDW